MGIHWSLPLLATISPPDIYSRIRIAQVDHLFSPPDCSSIPIINAKTSKKFKGFPLPKRHCVSRRIFREFSWRGVDVQASTVKAINSMYK
jgi:hypothetical protein